MLTLKIDVIEPYMDDIQRLFETNKGHRHEDNYLKRPLFDQTKFSRMGWAEDGRMVYYSAGIERPEYNGGIRIMSRHTRDTTYDFGGHKADLKRGLDTLDESTAYAITLGYTDIWVSREENPKLLEYFANVSNFDWNITHEDIPKGGWQWVLRLA